MKILFLSRYQDKVNRGVEVFVSEISQKLSRDHRVDIFSGSKADSLTAVLKGKYDVVIPINGRLQAIKISLGRVFGKYKLLISGHSGVGRDDILNILTFPSAFIALTEKAYQWAQRWAIGTRVYKIPNGVDLNKFTPAGGKVDFDLPGPIILSVGALEWYKHHDLAIQAVARLAEASLVIVGKGPLKNELERMGNRFLKNRFKIMEVDYSDMPKLYRSADLFTLPSWDREAFGIVYLEALASGLGIVAPDDSNRREIIGDAGILVDVFDIDKYAGALKKALTVHWRDKARKRATQFSWDKIAAMYAEVFEEIVKK